MNVSDLTIGVVRTFFLEVHKVKQVGKVYAIFLRKNKKMKKKEKNNNDNKQLV